MYCTVNSNARKQKVVSFTNSNDYILYVYIYQTFLFLHCCIFILLYLYKAALASQGAVSNTFVDLRNRGI